VCKQPAHAELETCGQCGRAFHRDCRVEHARADDDCGAHECLNCIEKERLYNSQLAKYNELKRDRKRLRQPKPLAVRLAPRHNLTHARARPKPSAPRNNMLSACLVCLAAFHTPECAPRGSLHNHSGFLCPAHAATRALPHDVLWSDNCPKRWDAFPLLESLVDPDAKRHAFALPRSLIEEFFPPPPPYESITANEYLAARPPQRSADVEMCRCRGDDCDEDCDNRATKVECTSANCRVQKASGVRCSNRLLQRGGVRAKCVPIKTAACGHGLRVCCHVKKGELVSEYVGEVLDSDLFEARLRDAPKGCVYYMEMSTKPRLFLDARFKGNVSRFANHSCDPSAVLGRWDVAGLVRIGLFARRDLSPGDEVTYDYGFTPFNGVTTPCRCGAATCRGTIEVLPRTAGQASKRKRPSAAVAAAAAAAVTATESPSPATTPEPPSENATVDQAAAAAAAAAKLNTAIS